MNEQRHIVVTINRQLGSGGAYVGQHLANRLGISYIDREIIGEAAKKLEVSENEIDFRDENVTSYWRSLAQLNSASISQVYNPPQIYIPSDKELFKAESEVIRKISRAYSCVIIGRCGSYILRQDPQHLSIFLHADMAFRQKRVQELYNLTEEKALKAIKESDAGRAKYFRRFTGQDWSDARQYNLSIDTGVFGLEKAEEMIIECIKYKFEDI